jgi:hypothetical protein
LVKGDCARSRGTGPGRLVDWGAGRLKLLWETEYWNRGVGLDQEEQGDWARSKATGLGRQVDRGAGGLG